MDDMGRRGTNLFGLVIPNSGHWLMEEQPAATVAAVRAFLDRKQRHASNGLARMAAVAQ